MQLPSWPKPHLRQALALCGLEQYEEAVAALDKGIQIMYSDAAFAADATASDPDRDPDLRTYLEAFQEAKEVAQLAGEAGGRIASSEGGRTASR